MSKQRIEEIEAILLVRNPKTTLGLRKELIELRKSEEAEKPSVAPKAPSRKKSKKSKK